MECDDYAAVTSERAGGAGRSEPRGGPAHRLFRGQIACDCFACPSFLPAPPSYSQFHPVTPLGPIAQNDGGRAAVPRLLDELQVSLGGGGDM